MNQNIIDQIIKLENELKTLKEMIAPVKPAVKSAVKKQKKKKYLPFSAYGIAVGEVLTYRPKKSKQDKIDVIVVDDHHIEFNGKRYTMSRFDAEMAKSGRRRGTLYFEYKGENLVDLRERLKL